MQTNHPYDRASGLSSNLCQALQVATADNETLFKLIMDTFQERVDLLNRASALTKECDELITERDAARNERDQALQLRAAYNANVDDWRELCSYFNLPVSELSAVLNAIETMRKERDDYRMECNTLRAIHTPVTHDPRYIVHGHVQPCVVLYSDETTTLVRMDEGDMMCETDTIQWSDALTYRCQELLAAAGVERGSMAAQRVLPVLVELVRAGHVTLNDEGVAVEQPDFVAPVVDDATALGADPAYFQKPCGACGHLFDEDDSKCPMCAAERAPVADDATSEDLRAYRIGRYRTW